MSQKTSNPRNKIKIKKPVVSHWVWAYGVREGKIVDKKHAKTLRKLDNFDKNLLKPIYKQEATSPLCLESMDIQTMLKDRGVAEYGSFVDKS